MGSGSATIGYSYFANWSIQVTQLASEIREIWYGGRLAWSGNVTENSFIFISARNLFGGDEAGGGLEGRAYIAFGRANQILPDEVKRAQGYSDLTLAPNKRGIVTITFLNAYVASIQKSVREVEVVTAYFPSNEIGNSRAGDSVNPANLIWEILTRNDEYKWISRPLSSSRMNKQSFVDANQVLENEMNLGSINYDASVTGEDILSNLLTVINGIIYTNRQGLITLRLFRTITQSDIDNAFIFNESTIQENTITELTRSIGSSGISSFQVLFKSRDEDFQRSYTAKSIIDQNELSESAQEELNFIDEYQTAINVSQQEQIKRSSDSMTIDITVSRALPGLPDLGDVCLIDLNSLYGKSIIDGVDSQPIIARAIEIDYSLDSEEIRYKIAEDLFTRSANVDLSDISVEVPDDTEQYIAKPLLAEFHSNAPWFTLELILNSSDFTDLDGSVGLITSFGAPAENNLTYAYELWRSTVTESIPDYRYLATGNYCYSAQLAGDIDRQSTSITITNRSSNAPSLLDNGEYLAFIGGEFIDLNIIDYATSDTFTISRGLFDTVPSTHSSGTTLFVVANNARNRYFAALNSETFLLDSEIFTKNRSRTARDFLSLGEAPEYQTTINARHYKPLPVAACKINNQFFPATRSLAATQTDISFYMRERKLQRLAFHSSWYDEAGQVTGEQLTFRIQFYDLDVSTVTPFKVDDLMGLNQDTIVNYSYAYADEIIDNGVLATNLRITIDSFFNDPDIGLIFNEQQLVVELTTV